VSQRISTTGIALIQNFEGCHLKAYPDPKTGGDPWTIGYGHTGKDVAKGQVITQMRAEELLRADLARFEAGVSAALTRPVTQSQFDAIVSFAFNCGLGALRGSTLLRMVNSGHIEIAADEFLKWISRGTPVEKGLLRRRKAERALFLGGDWRTAT